MKIAMPRLLLLGNPAYKIDLSWHLEVGFQRIPIILGTARAACQNSLKNSLLQLSLWYP
jgi:hypothetical protein